MKRICKYVVYTEDADNGSVLLYNTLNGTLLQLTIPDLQESVRELFNTGCLPNSTDPVLRKTLEDKMFILPSETNESELARFSYLESYSLSHTLSFLIYATDACNFRCKYCPESHSPHAMSIDTVDMLCESIEKTLNSRKYSKLSISWFGGEPLLNLPVIRHAMKRLGSFCAGAGLPISAGATTNGYLLTENTFTELLSLGVTHFQITVDGMSDTHDRTRPLVDGTGTWNTIHDNLVAMALHTEEFSVSLRINVNRANFESAKALILLIDKELDRRFRITIHPISNMGGNPTCTEYNGVEEGQRLQLSLFDFLDNNTNQGIWQISARLTPLGMLCNSARPNYYIVRTDGGIAKCELNIESKAAVLSEPGEDSLKEELLAQYVTPAIGQCENCRIYPLCFGLICPHRKALGLSCEYADSFLIEEYIKLFARHQQRGVTHYPENR